MPNADALPLPTNDMRARSVELLRAADLPISRASAAAEWSPDCKLPPSVWELFSSLDDAGGEALALGFAQMRAGADEASKPWLWIQDAQSIRRGGRPFLQGLPAWQRHEFIHVEARHPADALWAMEEGVRCGALSFVIGEIAGDPKVLDFTATRRLVLTSERHGVPLYLLRRGGAADLSAARLRWQVHSAPSAPHRWNALAPGAVRMAAELFRGRGFKPDHFVLEHAAHADEPHAAAGHRLTLVSEPRHRPLEQERRQTG